jgi:O-methyltransferase involved in polyketide biosynthesis
MRRFLIDCEGVMGTNKIHVNNDKGTYLMTLYGKAVDATAPDSILHDTYAADAVARLDFEFKSLKLPSGNEISLPLRARHFDEWTHSFLVENPTCAVLHLGCGLDTRVYRIHPAPTVRWYDVDLPDVIALREKLYPPREGYEMIASSVTDLNWLDAVPGDTPVCVVAEGLVMYLPEAEGLALFRRITEQFPSGQIAFDAYSSAMMRMVSRFAALRGAKVDLVWGMSDPHDLEKQVPKLRLAESVEFLTMPELVTRLAKNRAAKAMNGLMGSIPFYRKLIRHVRYVF